ncbi:glycoside hydrolase family 25 protein [Niabella insulamsoli]|uniref:glycoside hydrolase family 25 protein n=1 Tax=Niabella insulamsoli TaxID=3144874 RepID=UPI0031FD0629
MARRGKYNNIKLLASVFFVAFLMVALLQWVQSRKIKFVHYDAFGIDMPVAYALHGIDVSRYQKKIAWNGVKEMNVNNIQLNFAFIKATEGQGLTDKYFKSNWRNAKKAGITRGAYHFFIASQDPAKQAKHFISKVKLSSGDLPPVLDAEQASIFPVNVFRQKVRAWLAMVEAHYNVKPIIYTNAAFYKKYLGPEFDSYPLWVAHYYEKRKPRINREWTFWQHNDLGNVNGIDAKVDFNVFNGDIIAFNKLLMP